MAVVTGSAISGVNLLMKALTPVFSKVKEGIRNNDLEEALLDLSQKITNVVKIKTIDRIDESVDLHDFYIPTDIYKEEGRVQINHLEDIDIQSIVLEGTVGQGKSIFMRYLTYTEAELGKRIPIFYELRRLGDKQTIEEAVKTTFKNWISIFEDIDFEKIAKSGDLVIFLDGFDEIPQARVKDIINEIEGWCEKYPKLQLVISSRPEADIQKSTYFKVFKLAPYNIDKQFLLINKLVKDEDIRNSLKKSIQDSSHEIKELLKTPLMVNLYIMKYRAKLEVPKTQSEFYEDLFNLLISKHDKSKIGYRREFNSSLNEIELQRVFEEFCFISGNKEQVSFDTNQAISIIERSIEKTNLEANPYKVLEDFSKIVCLLQNDGLGYTFIHRSIQEYFYANYISQKSATTKENFYNKLFDISFLLSKRNVIFFLENIDRYYYYKYFLDKLIENLIVEYQIKKNENIFLDKMYIIEVPNHDTFRLMLIMNSEYFTVHHSMYILPFENFTYQVIMLIKDSISVFTFKTLKNLNDDEGGEMIKIKDYIKDIGEFEKLKRIANDRGNLILHLKEEVQNYLDQKESLDFD